MMWLFEERQAVLPVIVIGVITVVLLGAGWAKTGRKEILYALGAVVLLVAALLGLQRFVTTEREKVEATLQIIARDVERNDMQAVLDHIVHSQSSDARKEAEAELPNYKFTLVKITKFDEVLIDLDHVPPQAVAKFTVAVEGKDPEGFLDGQTIYRYVVVTFYKEDGRWRVHDYQHYEPQRAIMK